MGLFYFPASGVKTLADWQSNIGLFAQKN